MNGGKRVATRVATHLKHGDIPGHNQYTRTHIEWGLTTSGVPMLVTYKEGVTGSSPVAPTVKPTFGLRFHDRSPG